MKITRFDDWIEACEELRIPYKNDRPHEEGRCPLCTVASREEKDASGFSETLICICLWELFDDKLCTLDIEDSFIDRVPRLERWIKKLKEMKEKK